jgi:uncharacterized membrane protein YdjX (TVP38/TMEM64 family)
MALQRVTLGRVVGVGAVALVLAVVWKNVPLRETINLEYLFHRAEPLRENPLGPLIWAIIYALASLTFLPLLLLTVVTVMLFGTWKGFFTAMLGCQLGAMFEYGLGRVLLGSVVKRLIGDRLGSVTRALTSHGWLAVFALRLVPVAPFAVVNVVAGSSRIPPWGFFWATMLGMAPVTLGLALAADRVVAAAKDPTPGSVTAAGIVLFLVVLLGVVASKLIERARNRAPQAPVPPPRPSGA